MALADTSDGFYSIRNRRVIDETDRQPRCPFARKFSELALQNADIGEEWIVTKQRSFDTEIRDPF